MEKTSKNNETAQLGIGAVSSRILVATQIMNAFISNGGINHYDGETIIAQDPTTNRKISATEQQNEQIKHYTRIAYKIADSLLQYGC